MPTRTSLTPADLTSILDSLAAPGEPPPLPRQPVHVVYGGGHLWKSDTARKLAGLARKAAAEHLPDDRSFVEAFGLEPAIASEVRTRVVRKLDAEAVEDFRIDFEDGYGSRPDAEEDEHATAAARALAHGAREKTLPPFVGVRPKALSPECARRSVRTLDLFLTALAADGGVPPGFRVTLPKVQSPSEVAALVSVLETLELRLGLPRIPIEIMVETPRALLGSDGRPTLPFLHLMGGDRLVAAHFGTYDYTAALGIAASHQHPSHPACDFARHQMQLTFAGTNVALSDGATTTLPIGDAAEVRRAMSLHYANIRRSLELGFWQSWDLHPAQIPVRWVAVYAFFLEGLPAATTRLRNFVERAAQATRVGGAFDDAATGQGLLNFFARGVQCGALGEADVKATGLTMAELGAKSFSKIAAARAG